MNKQHFEILLEKIDSKFDLVLEGYAALNRKIDNVQNSLDDYKRQNKEEQNLLFQMIREVNQKVDKLDQKVDKLDKKVDKLDQKVDKLDKKVDKLDKNNVAAHAAFNKKLDEREKETAGLKQRLTRLEAA